MLRKLLIASFFLGIACAVHLEYLRVDPAEEPQNGILILDTSGDSVDQVVDLLKSEEQLPGMCWACGWIMKKLRRQIGKNANEGIIKSALSQVCDSIGFLRSLCKGLISKFMDTLVEELSTTDDPKTICANIGACSSKGMRKLSRAFPRNYY